MKINKILVTFLLLLTCANFAYSQFVGHKQITFTDPARSNRSIPCDVYYPAIVAGENVAMATGSFPLIVFGHGFVMADPALYSYLWQKFAELGYIFVFPTTEGSMLTPIPNHLNFGLDLKFLNVQIKAENTVSTSFFYGKVSSKTMIMGHSMGGKATYIGSANNTDITAVVSLAAAMSNPPIGGGTLVDALKDYVPSVVVPTLVVDAQFDCVVPAAEGHKFIYDTLTTACKTYVNIKGGGHCFFASSDASNCETGENNCSSSFTITRAQQNQTVLDFVVPYVNFMLKDIAADETVFLNYLNTSTAITKERDCKVNDLTTVQITAPVSICTLTDNENVTIKIKNNGSATQSNFQVAYKINTAAPIVETITSTLAPYARLDYTFTQKANLSAAGTYTLKTYTTLASDEDHTNDTIIGSIVNNNVAIPLVVSFTGYTGANLTTVFPGWSEANTVSYTGTTSSWLNRTGLGTASNVTAKVNFTGTTLNEWIIGPSFKPTAYTKMTYDAAVTGYNVTTAYANGMSTNDQVKIMVSTNCGTTWTMLNAQTSTSGLTNTLTEKIVDLGAYAGQSIKVAFYATRSATATNNYDFHIDNINIKNFAPIDMAPIALVSPTGPSACRSNNETITVKIHNYGAANMDFAVNNMTLNVLVNNGAGAYPFNFSKTINSGTLTAGAEMDIVMTTTYDMTRPGIHSFTITSTTNGDGNTANDNLATISINATNPEVYITGDTTLCPGQITVLTANASVSGGAGDLVLLNNTSYAIPDNNTTGIQSPIVVTNSTALASQVISVTIDSITHPYVGDLKLSLIAPNASTINLVVNRGTSGDNFTGTVFISSATASITSGTAPFTGQFLPEQAFSLLTGNAQGTWNLKAVDNSGNDVGTIKGWTLKLPSTNSITNYSWSTGETGATVSQINYTAPVANTTCSVTVTDANGCSASDIVPISITNATNFSLGQDREICQGASTIIDAGAGYDTYLWQNGSTSQTYTATTTGVVSVTVTGDCGTLTDQLNVTVNPLPTISLGANQAICQGDYANLDAGSGFAAYLWSTGATTQQISTNTQGSYTVTVTNSNQCKNTASVSVTVNPLPTVNLGNNQTICQGNSANLDAGSGFVVYLWSTGATTQQISTNTQGSYTVTVTNSNQCKNTASVSVTVNALPTINISSASTVSICKGTSTDITFTLTGTSPWSIVTNNGTSNTTSTSTTSSFVLSVNPTVNTTYSIVSISDASTCSNTSTASVVVNVNEIPAAPSVSNVNACLGSIVPNFTTTATGTINWYNDVNLTDLAHTGDSFASGETASGTYTYYVNATENTCTGPATTVTLTINVLPSVTITDSHNPSACGTSTGDATVSVGSSYSWNTIPVQTTQQATNLAAGSYTVTVSDGNCTNAATVVLTDPGAPNTHLNFTDTTICVGETVTFTGLSATEYEFFVNGISQGNPSTNAIFTGYVYSNGDVVYVNGTTAGCTASSQSVIVSVHTPEDINITENNGTLTSSATVGNQWYEVTSGIITGEVAQTYSPVADGYYYTVITDDYCVAYSDTIHFIYTSIANVSNNTSVKVYPNPNTGIFNLAISTISNQNIFIELRNIQGQIIFKKQVNVNSNYNESFDFSYFSKGIYYLKVNNGVNVQITKIVIE